MTMEAVSSILKTLVVRAFQNNLDLTYDVEPDIPNQLIGDSLRLRQVITNVDTHDLAVHGACASRLNPHDAHASTHAHLPLTKRTSTH
jgi:hypothetical protein